MRPLRYSVNVTLDGCCDHRVIEADEELHRHAAENLARADALLFGRITYQMMETAFRPGARTAELPEWMDPFARVIDASKKYVVSGTLERVDWNAELLGGDLRKAVEALKREPGEGPQHSCYTKPTRRCATLKSKSSFAFLMLSSVPTNTKV